MSEATATLPVSFFEGKELKEGSRCMVEIVAVGHDSVEVSYVSHESDGNQGEEQNANDMIDSAVESGGGY